jgi:hypothetical protein
MAETLKLIRKKDMISALTGTVIDSLDSNSPVDAPSIRAVKEYINSQAAVATQTIVLNTNWAKDAVNNYYTQSVSAVDVEVGDTPLVNVVLNGDLNAMNSQQAEWAKVIKTEAIDGAMKFYATEATTIELNILVKNI